MVLEGTCVAPHTVNDVAYMTRINHEGHGRWQAQYLVTLEDHLVVAAV